jgi:hypothetical protein
MRRRRDKTILTGWDWVLGAMTLSHGFVTFGPTVWWADGFARGLGIWLAASLLGAAGFGWRFVIDRRGFAFSRTWFGIPFTRRRHPIGSTVVVEDDPFTPDGADWSEWVCVDEGAPRPSEFGSAPNAAAIVRAVEHAVARHHRRSVPPRGSVS